MPHICPRPCSRLATAAVFISVGVVQFVVGIILLRSKYVYLLAGPDFWTSSCNIAVGCLLGVSASVWKRSRRRISKTQILRRNLLLALLFSALLMNATTLGIFLLGEGNTLLSIRLENGGKYSHSTFANEVLAYAYVTSVCCPIVCIVIAIVCISGSCFKHAARKKLLEMKPSAIRVEKERPLRWIYTPELLDLSKKKLHELILSSSSESLSEDDSDAPPKRQKYSTSAEDIQHVLNRMAQGKRDSILSDSAIMLRQMGLRRKGRFDSINKDESYMGPILPYTRESQRIDRHQKSYSTEGNGNSISYHSDVEENYRLPPADVGMKRLNYAKSKELGTIYKEPYTCEELVNEYQTAASKLSKHYPSQYKRFRGRFQTSSNIDGPPSSCASDTSGRIIKAIATVHKTSAKVPTFETKQEDSSSGHRNQNRNEAAKFQENELYQKCETTAEILSPNDCFSPDGSEFGGDSTFDVPRRSSWAGEVVPINLKHSTAVRLSQRLIPVASPVVPDKTRTGIVPKISDDSGIDTIESSSFTEIQNGDNMSDGKSKLSSFREVRNKGIMQEYPTIASQSTKKYDLNRVSPMESISEEPNMELNSFEEVSQRSYDSQDGAVNKTWKSHNRSKSLCSIQSVLPKGTNHDADNSRRETTPKRKRSASGKSLRKLWSLAVSENQNDFLDQVVDADSLIGLSEEELIARQFRTRSIRKAVQQRMKEEMTV